MNARTIRGFGVAIVMFAMLGSFASVHAAGIFDFFTKSSDSAQEERAKKQAALPRCAKPIGSISIAPPENQWWRGFNLQSPEALIKLFIQRSRCFAIVDRGRGYDAAMRERALSEGGELQAGGEIAKRSIKAAQFVLIPDLVSNNQDAGGSGAAAILGILGNLIVPGAGALAGSVRTIDRNATVTLAVTNTKTLEQVVMAEGYAEKTDSGFAFGGAGITSGAFGAAGAGSYANTEAGQVIANAYLDAYIKLVQQMGGELSAELGQQPNQPAQQPEQPPAAVPVEVAPPETNSEVQ